MADISQIKLPDNNTYNFKDTLARGLKMYYGLCTSAGDTAAKVVTVGADQDFKLTVGALLMVKFTKSNTASNVTLNVNGTGAKGIYYNNAVFTGTSDSVCGYANANFIYMYGGTNWIWVGRGANSTYSAMSVAEGKTATATNSRTMRADYLKQIIQYHAVPSGQGVPAGGTAGQVLAKVDGTDYNTEWITPSGGGGITWENVGYTEVKTIPTESFYWHIANSTTYNQKTPSSSNLELMPFLFKTGRSSYLGGDIYFMREYYTDTLYKDTVIFVSGTAGVETFVLHREKDGKWYCDPYVLLNIDVTGTFNNTTQKYDFTTTVAVTSIPVYKWAYAIWGAKTGNLVNILASVNTNTNNPTKPWLSRITSNISSATASSGYFRTEMMLYKQTSAQLLFDVYVQINSTATTIYTPSLEVYLLTAY